jgi:hypothetical protein
MEKLLKKLQLSIEHLECLDSTFRENHEEYKRIEILLKTEPYVSVYEEISRELYAGGKSAANSKIKLNRQMILGDIIEYIFSGRAYYYATKSEINFNNFLKMILYCVNQILIYDVITIDPVIRKKYIEKLESTIPHEKLYEKEGDQEIAEKVKTSDIIIRTNERTSEIDMFVDSLLPKTLGCPKELVVFAELIRMKKGIIVPLLLIQRIFGEQDAIAPPDFLLLKKNKDIYGIEVGYKKELQSREFPLRTSIPTFAVDLKNNMHNRCPICGENILYCDPVINSYSSGILNGIVKARGGKFYCKTCPNFDDGRCIFSNYHGVANGNGFDSVPLPNENRHYHAKCVRERTYNYRRREKNILESFRDFFFAQIPEIDGLNNL